MPECSCPPPYADCPHPPNPIDPITFRLEDARLERAERETPSGPISFRVGQANGVAHVIADCPECDYQSAKMPGPAAAALDVINHGLREHVERLGGGA